MDEVGDQVVPGGVDFHDSRIHTKGGEPAREALDFRYELTELLPEHPTLGRVLEATMVIPEVMSDCRTALGSVLCKVVWSIRTVTRSDSVDRASVS